MLDDVFIDQILKEVMAKYEAEHHKVGLAKEDVLDAVMKRGGDIQDVRKVMVEGACMMLKSVPGIKELYE